MLTKCKGVSKEELNKIYFLPVYISFYTFNFSECLLWMDILKEHPMDTFFIIFWLQLYSMSVIPAVLSVYFIIHKVHTKYITWNLSHAQNYHSQQPAQNLKNTLFKINRHTFSRLYLEHYIIKNICTFVSRFVKVLFFHKLTSLRFIGI